jgi:gliding motility-associated-like protein
MLRKYFLFLLWVAFFAPAQLVAQFEADGAIITDTTIYSSTTENDMVFVFPSDAPMIVSTSYQSAGYSYTWYRHSGYRVYVEDEEGVEVADERCWLYNNQALTRVDAEVDYADCFIIQLLASSESEPLLYYGPDGSSGTVEYEVQYEWSAVDNQNISETGSSVRLDAPYDASTYKVSVSDRFGNTSEARIDYEAIAVNAVFETEVLKETVEHERHDEARGSAPIEIRFTDESEGGVTACEWTFGSAGRSVERNPLFVFSQAGTDSVTLRVVNNDSGCEDISDPFVVNVWESELDVPNVFTPNGDGFNDEFRVAYGSLKEFEMVVFNRWGRKVYENTDPQKGWDGTVGGKMGDPGVYFYYIRGRGYNEKEVHKKEGSIHLIRGK